ncbi:MAG: hypothetical protein IJW16_02595, partial [Clostridia bacterium]|nr:hypothetical protein [Clostridia bacterium]
KYFIRRVEENLVSEKYRMTYVRDQEKQHATRSYNHSEVLTMPKEVFMIERVLPPSPWHGGILLKKYFFIF